MKKQQTNPAWGIVAVAGAVAAVTMGNSIIMAAIGAAMFFFGAWKGGYMNETVNNRPALRQAQGPANMERRAA